MKVKIANLPKGYKVFNGKIIRTMKEGGSTNKTLKAVSRDKANLEAEKGETALTDLNNEGSFELYNIGGKRHTEGGTPLNLPEQSFVFSDTRKMLLSTEELKTLGIDSKTKMTPAEASKKFPLNKYIEILEDKTSDKISVDTAEEMINANKIKLSQIAFLQESKKDFQDGLPVAAYPFLISKGINPQELEAKIAEKNAPQQMQSPEMSQEQMAMGPQQGALQQFTGPPQGGMPPMGPQGGMPPEMMAAQEMPPMGRYGTELPQAMFGMAGLKYANPFMKNRDEKLQKDVSDMMGMAKTFAGGMAYGGATHKMPDGTVHPGATHEDYMNNMSMYAQKGVEMYKNPQMMQNGGPPDIAKAMQLSANPASGIMGAIKDGTANNAMSAWFSGDVNGWANAGPARYGTEVPKYQGGGTSKVIKNALDDVVKGIKKVPYKIQAFPTNVGKFVNRTTNTNLNPLMFDPMDNVLISKGGNSRPNIGINTQGVGNLTITPDKYNSDISLGDFNLNTPYRDPDLRTMTQNSNFGKISLMHKGLNSQYALNQGGLTFNPKIDVTLEAGSTLDPSITAAQSLDILKFFNIEQANLKPWSNDIDWTTTDFSNVAKDFITTPKGEIVYNGKKIKITSLNPQGLQELEKARKFHNQHGSNSNLQYQLFNNEFSGITNNSQVTDWHSPLLRGIGNGFKGLTGLGDIRIGNGLSGSKSFTEYNQFPLIALTLLGGASILYNDKQNNEGEEGLLANETPFINLGISKEDYEKGLSLQQDTVFEVPDETEKEIINKQDAYGDSIKDYLPNDYQYGGRIPTFLKGGNTGTKGATLCDAYDRPLDYNPNADINKNYKGPGMRNGGEPFKMNQLRRFTEGGPSENSYTNQLYGAPLSDDTIYGGTLPEVGIFGKDIQEISQEQQMLMSMREQRRFLLQEYTGLTNMIQSNPNITEDPEQGEMLMMQMMQIEEEIKQLDEKSDMIERQLLQDRSQINPFNSEESMQQARYGGSLRKFENGGEPREGETYGQYMTRRGQTPQPNNDLNAKYNATTKKFHGKAPQKYEDIQYLNIGDYQNSDPSYLSNRTDATRFPETYSNLKNYNQGTSAHNDFYNIMGGDQFQPVREAWMESTKKELNGTGRGPRDEAGKKLWNEVKNMSNKELYSAFNKVNEFNNMAGAGTNTGADTDFYSSRFKGKDNQTTENFQKRIDEFNTLTGGQGISRKEMMAYQVMYGGLAQLKDNGTEQQKALLKNINLRYSTNDKGSIEMKKGPNGEKRFVSQYDGLWGDTGSTTYASAINEVDTEFDITNNVVGCTEEQKTLKMNECLQKGMDFDERTCNCIKKTKIPPPVIPEKPRYETFPQDDLARATKSGQFPDIINPTRQGTPDPAMVDPMYVDPRQQLSVLESTAAAAIRAGADPSSVMGAMQDQSEKVINQHESLNTKIYNNAMNINVPALNQFTKSAMDNEKNYIDQTAMAMGNYQTEYKDAEDALLEVEQKRMSNADEMYIRNLENPNYWYSPQDHNIEFYNDKNITGQQTNEQTFDSLYASCKELLGGGTTEPENKDILECVKQKQGAKTTTTPLNTTPASELASLGLEVKSFAKRQKELEQSRKKLRKWITGH